MVYDVGSFIRNIRWLCGAMTVRKWRRGERKKWNGFTVKSSIFVSNGRVLSMRCHRMWTREHLAQITHVRRDQSRHIQRKHISLSLFFSPSLLLSLSQIMTIVRLNVSAFDGRPMLGIVSDKWDEMCALRWVCVCARCERISCVIVMACRTHRPLQSNRTSIYITIYDWEKKAKRVAAMPMALKNWSHGQWHDATARAHTQYIGFNHTTTIYPWIKCVFQRSLLCCLIYAVGIEQRTHCTRATIKKKWQQLSSTTMAWSWAMRTVITYIAQDIMWPVHDQISAFFVNKTLCLCGGARECPMVWWFVRVFALLFERINTKIERTQVDNGRAGGDRERGKGQKIVNAHTADFAFGQTDDGTNRFECWMRKSSKNYSTQQLNKKNK